MRLADNCPERSFHNDLKQEERNTVDSLEPLGSTSSANVNDSQTRVLMVEIVERFSRWAAIKRLLVA